MADWDSFEKLSSIFSSKDYTLVEATEINSNGKYTYICNKHIEKGVQIISHAQFISRNRGCKYCGIEKSNKNGRKRSIDDVRIEFEKYGLIVLPNQEYLSGKHNIKFICKNHEEIGVQEITYDTFSRKESKGCSKCIRKIASQNQKKPFSEIVAFLNSCGYRLVSTEADYKNTSSILSIECKKHGVFEISWQNFYTRKRCQECGYDLSRGENHPFWNNGITHIRKHLRKKLKQWKLDSALNCNFRCVISGEKFDAIHHLHAFDLILEEAMNNLNLTIKQCISDYTVDELRCLENEILRLHGIYPLGVCLRKDIHLLFHSLYGLGKNTEEQFEEFRVRWSNGEFETLFELKIS